jgi:hypothetical protein
MATHSMQRSDTVSFPKHAVPAELSTQGARREEPTVFQ